MLVLPGRAKPVRDLLHDLPIRPAAFHRLENLVQPLDTPFRAGEGTLLLQARTSGQHYVRELAGLAKKDILNHEEVELAETGADIVGIRIDDAHLFTKQVHPLELPLVNRLNHFAIVQTLDAL